MADDEIVIGIRAAFDDFIGEFRKLTKDIARSSQDIQDSLNQAFDTKKAQANIKSLATEQKQAFQVIESYSKKVPQQYNKNGIAVTDYMGKVRAAATGQKLIVDSSNQAAAAMGGLNENIKQTVTASPALRYALYDISNSLRDVAISAAALAVLPIGFSIKYEREFANVIRTSGVLGDEINDLRADLIEIAQATPISWEEITRIATLAGQLNIAKEQIAAFTETVAQFAATTDVSVEASATAFGRLDQLVDGIDGQFENLGSAILAVGVESVATESQIIAVSTQIASMGNLAGLTAPEIIGLSGALSSLGIAPELARGTITRLFTEIGQAATTGGRELEEFGRITGRSAAEFTAAWEDEPSAVIQDFFDGINKEGPEAERTLRSLGITSVRDIPAILRLAQSSDEVRRLIALSNEEFAAGTRITEQYGIISGTVAEQLNRLVQNFGILAATIGDTVNPLSFLVGGLNAVVEGITAFAQIPAGQIVFGFGVLVAATTALLAGYGAILATVAAGVLAFRFAQKELASETVKLNAALLYSPKAMLAFIAAVTGAGNATGAAAAKVGLFSKALSFAGPIGIALTAISAIGIAVSYFSQQAESGEEKANRLGVSLEALGSAIEADTTALENGEGALRQYELSVQKAGDSLQTTAKDASDFLDAEESAPEVIDATTTALEKQTKALGENATEFAKNQILKDEDIRTLFADPAAQQAFIQAGGDPVDLLLAGLEGRSDEYINGLLKFYQNAQTELINERRRINTGQEEGQEIGGPRYQEIAKEIEFYSSQAKILDGVLRDNLEAVGATKVAYDEAASSGEFFADAQEGVQQKSTIAGDAIDEALNSLFQQENFIKDVSDSITGLGDAFRGSGEEAFASTGAIQNVIDTIANNAPMGDTNIILGNLGGLLLFLQTLGPAAAGGVSLVTSAISLLGGEAGYAADEAMRLAIAQSAITGFDISAAFNKIGSSAGGASAKVKTLAEQFDELVDSMFETINLGRDTEDAIFALGEAFGESGDQALYASDEMQDAIGAILKQSDSAEQGVANLAALFAHLAKTAGGQSAPSLQILRQAISQVGAQFGLSTAQVQQFIATAGGGLANINLNNFNLGLQNAQKEVRTLLDYASDLENVFTRAFDIRFGETLALDDIAESFQNLAEQVEDARFELEELQASQSDLSADRGLKQYFLSIAEAYGDTLRAAQLRKEIAQLDREQAENARRLQETQALAGGDLTGQGAGQRQNRQALLGLVQDYQDYITALAESGASQEELRAATEEARREFIQQATELGFQESVVLEYAAAFDDVQTAISKVERNITVEANVNPALQALNELNAKLNESINIARELNSVLGGGGGGGGGGNLPVVVVPSQKDVLTAQVKAYDARINQLNNAIGLSTGAGSDARDRISAKAFKQEKQALVEAKRWTARAAASYAQGGFTGRGGMMEPAGIVHRGEYVVPKQYVNQSTGLPDPSFLAQLQNGMRGYQMGGFVGGGGIGSDGPMMVELSPYDRKLLADAGNVQLRLNGRVVAEATNQSNVQEARRGSN